MSSDFYKYIVGTKTGYEIVKNNQKYGTYTKLTDALYERDRLIKANWDWETCLQLEETKNHYEKMKLPKFIHEYTYIYKVYNTFEVFVGDECKGKFNTKIDAFEFADEVHGKVYMCNPRYRIQKRINGVQKSFGDYNTFEEAKRMRDKLIRNGWKK